MRITAYIDGFNFYHRLNEIALKTGNNYKWLNYPKLIHRLFIDDPALQHLQPIQLAVKLFTARPTHKPLDVQERHSLYMQVLKTQGVMIQEGYFKAHLDPNTQRTEVKEKQSDVALAISLYQDAHNNHYDGAVLLSGDADFVPAIKAIRQDFSEKHLVLMTPPNAGKCHELKSCFTMNPIRVRQPVLEQCQLPQQLTATHGKIILNPYPVSNFIPSQG